MENNRIVAYSLLAHINNNNEGINDLSEIFIPIVKKSLYILSKNNITKGISSDLKQSILLNFGLDMPFSIIKKIMRIIQKEYTKKDNNEFILYEDGSFILNKFVFAEYDSIIKEQESEIEAVNFAYQNFALSHNYSINDIPSLFVFLDKNRISLSNFFANKIFIETSIEYDIAAKFLDHMKNDGKVFEILKKIYLGSVISSYLELNYDDIKDFNVEFLLDTNFVVDLIGLASIEVWDTCTKIIDICNKLNFKISVLDVTIEETKNLLYKKAGQFDSVFLTKQLDPENIFNACQRLNYTKTDLEKLASKIETLLKTKYKINIIHDSTKYQNIARFSSEYSILKNRKINPEGAMHDAIAISYVKTKRGKKVKEFHEANCWFVTISKQSLNLIFQSKEYLPEFIKPEELVNILWLTSPKVNSKDIVKIGMTRLISSTINNSLPNHRIIKELDDNIIKYCKDKIEPEDCARLAQRAANKTINNLDIENLNNLAKSSPDDFVRAINEEVEKAKIEESKYHEQLTKSIQNIQKDFDNKLKTTLDEKLNESSNNYKYNIDIIKRQHDEIIKQKDIETIRNNNSILLNGMKEKYKFMKGVYTGIESNSRKFFNIIIIISIIVYILILLTLIFLNTSETLNNIASIISIIFTCALPVIGFGIIVAFEKKLNPMIIYNILLKKRIIKKCSNINFNHTEMEEINAKIKELESEV